MSTPPDSTSNFRLIYRERDKQILVREPAIGQHFIGGAKVVYGTAEHLDALVASLGLNPILDPSTTASETAAKSFPKVSNIQLRRQMLSMGVLPSQVDALIDSIPDSHQREGARSEWDYNPTFERTHPLVAQLGAGLGLTTEQIDSAFRHAATL